MHVSIMQRLARILVIVCVFLCLTVNYTFPIHKLPSDIIPFGIYHNGRHNQCGKHKNRNRITNQRVKKSAFSINNSKKTKHLTPKHKRNNIETTESIENIKNVDLRQYEQLVIMKKYPYLDIKELEMKYRPTAKSVRHSLTFDSGLGIENDPGVCEQGEDVLNVEISNRGLSGFSIPVLSVKQNIDNRHESKNYAVTKSRNVHSDKTQKN